MTWERLEVNGGQVKGEREESLQLSLPVVTTGYANAQISDYQLKPRRFRWHSGTKLRLRARFSHPEGELVGTAGFGFWNAPFSDPRVTIPRLPAAVWFFYASAPADLPLAPPGQLGRGWFVATIDATTLPALSMTPLAPFVLLLNQIPALRERIWPAVQRRLGISFMPLAASMTDWHEYELLWQAGECAFMVDGETVFEAPHSPRGALGFVCWLDNQTMILRPTGRIAWRNLLVPEPQKLEVEHLVLEAAT